MSDHTANLSKEGRVLIPATIRQELGLRAGEPLSISVVDGEVRIVSRLAALRFRTRLDSSWKKLEGFQIVAVCA